MPAYLTPAEYSAGTWIADSWLSDALARKAGILDNALVQESARIDVNLAKRYAVPFELPAPITVQRWLIQLVNVQVMLVIGVDQTDLMYQVVQDQYNTVLKELEAAADSENGLIELPLKATDPAIGVTKGFPRAYSEQSPYVTFSTQRRIGRDEDERGGGSFR